MCVSWRTQSKTLRFLGFSRLLQAGCRGLVVRVACCKMPCLAAWARLLWHIHFQQLQVKLPRLGCEGVVLPCLAAWARVLWQIHSQQLEINLQRFDGGGGRVALSGSLGAIAVAHQFPTIGSQVVAAWARLPYLLVNAHLPRKETHPVSTKPWQLDFQLLEMNQQSRPSHQAKTKRHQAAAI